MTGLNPSKDMKTVYLYSIIIPDLVSEDKVEQFHKSRSYPTDYTVQNLIDLNAEIPHSIRLYLNLDRDKYRVIHDLFKRDCVKVVAAKAKHCCRNAGHVVYISNNSRKGAIEHD